MLEMLRSPPAPFADAIRRHFWLKRDEIIAQVPRLPPPLPVPTDEAPSKVSGWIREMEEEVSGKFGEGVGVGSSGAPGGLAGLGRGGSSLLVKAAVPGSRNMGAHLAQLSRHFGALKEELRQLKPPPGLAPQPQPPKEGEEGQDQVG